MVMWSVVFVTVVDVGTWSGGGHVFGHGGVSCRWSSLCDGDHGNGRPPSSSTFFCM